jgi:hypothetical protein
MSVEVSSNHGSGINLNWIFISIVPVVVLPFIEGQIHIPKERRPGFNCEGNHTEKIVYNCIAEGE